MEMIQMDSIVVTLLTIVICVGILVGGLLAVLLDSLLSAVVSAGLASLFASVVYVILSAPDVAMTEASIGSGLATMIFLYAIRNTRARNGQQSDSDEFAADDDDNTASEGDR